MEEQYDKEYIREALSGTETSGKLVSNQLVLFPVVQFFPKIHFWSCCDNRNFRVLLVLVTEGFYSLLSTFTCKTGRTNMRTNFQLVPVAYLTNVFCYQTWYILFMWHTPTIRHQQYVQTRLSSNAEEVLYLIILYCPSSFCCNTFMTVYSVWC